MVVNGESYYRFENCNKESWSVNGLLHYHGTRNFAHHQVDQLTTKKTQPITVFIQLLLHIHNSETLP